MKIQSVLLALSILMLNALILPLQATSWVTESSISITISNSYYTIVINKDASARGYGAIVSLKSNSGNNIVASRGFVGLGTHEYQNLQGNYFPKQWSDKPSRVYTAPTLLTITNDYVVVFFKARWQELIVEEWKTFYYDKPFYLVSYKRTYTQDIQAVQQDQVCFLFNDTWLTNWVYRLHNGTLMTDYETDWLLPMEPYTVLRQSYPWIHVRNSFYNEGYGMILLEASRPKLTGINPHWLSDGNYEEFQITHDNFKHGVSQNYLQTATYIGYVTPNYSDVEQSAIDFFYSSYEVNSYQGSLGNTTTLHAPCGRDIGPTYTDMFRISRSAKGFWNFEITIQPRLKNDNGLFRFFVYPTEVDSYWSPSEASKTWSSTYEDNIRLNLAVLLHNYSDTITTTFTFEILENINITRLEANVVSVGSSNWVRVNSTFAYVEWEDYGDYYGVAVKDSWGNSSGFQGYATLNFIDHTSQREYTPKILKYQFEWQPYYQYEPYVVDDWLAETESNWLSGRNYWINLYDAPGLRILDFSSINTRLLYHKLSDDNKQLTLLIDSDNGEAKVYCGELGQPLTVKVDGTPIDFNYENKTKIVNFNLTFAGANHININWHAFEENKAPSPSFTYSPPNPSIEDNINFIDTSTDPDGTINSWFWEFGDGSSSTERNPSHQYADKGEYTVRLTVTDDDGSTNTAEQTITIRNLSPTASFTYSPSSPTAGQEVSFTDASSDLEGHTIISWFWNFGDGYTSTAKNPTHKYENPGSYTVTLTVKDDEDLKGAYSTIIDVKPDYTIYIVIGCLLAASIFAAMILKYVRRKKLPPPPQSKTK